MRTCAAGCFPVLPCNLASGAVIPTSHTRTLISGTFELAMAYVIRGQPLTRKKVMRPWSLTRFLRQ